MAEQITLRAGTGRTPGSRESRRLRREGAVPAIVYGRDVDQPIPITIDHHDLVAALSTEAGSNAIIYLDVDGREVVTMPRVVEKHPYRNLIRHVDFITVDLTETVRAEVALHLVGEPEGVREGGVLSQPRGTVTIEALPAEIPSAIEYDVSGMQLHDTLRIGDLPRLEGVSYVDDEEVVVANVSVPRATIEEEAEAAEEEAAAEAEAEAAGEEAPAEEEEGTAGEE